MNTAPDTRDELIRRMRLLGLFFVLFGIAACIYVASVGIRPIVGFWSVASILMGLYVMLKPQKVADRRLRAEARRSSEKHATRGRKDS